MPWFIRIVLLAVFVASVWPQDVRADRKTVCTITVNSPDEKETFRRSLPPGDFEFVELVERGRPDWLASACRQGVRCDALLISGHFDDGDEFYSDRVEARESLPVDEMARVSCSDSCPGLFSQLKEVYLFGCNTLNADALKSTSPEIVRSFLRAGYSQADAEQLSRVLNERHAESNRDRMRQIFKDVPVIYGFSSKAPLGPVAAAVLDRYFQSGATGEIASGRPSAKLLSLFAPVSMTVVAGANDSDAQAGYRRDVCKFADDRLSTAQKLGFVHRLLRRDMAEVRMFLDQLERYVASLGDAARSEPAVAGAIDAIAQDRSTRERYLVFARDADQPAVRARMIALAVRLGWLTAAERRTELVRLIDDQLHRGGIGPDNVDLICSLNRDRQFDGLRAELRSASRRPGTAGHEGILACLGSADARVNVLQALTSAKDEDVEIAQVYLRHQPIADADEMRRVAAAIMQMKAPSAQVRALDTLARQRLSDHESLDDALTRLFSSAKSLDVQRAIAGILIRADYQRLARPELIRALQQHRIKSSEGRDLIDVLIHRLQANVPAAA